MLWLVLNAALLPLIAWYAEPKVLLFGSLGSAALLIAIAWHGFGWGQSQTRKLRQELTALERGAAAALEGAQRESQRLSAVLDGMAEGIWITDETGVVLRHNDALKQMLYAGQELVGQRPLSLVRNAPLHESVLGACERGESTDLELLIEGVRPRALSVRIVPLGQELKGSAAVFHDVTELRRLQRIREDFVANVSHELRTPITAIRGYAETLRGGALSDVENAPQMVEIIHRQSERLSELVTDLLDLSRLDAGELALHPTQVRLHAVAQRASEVVGPKAVSKRLTLRLTVDPALSALADEEAVEQVLINLLDNAIKYTPDGGTLELRGRRDGDLCVLEVRDNGLGIEQKHLSRLFERFYRVDRGRSRDMGGTGLGLSIVKNLVEAMHGEVRVTSQPGEGSTFTVTLPTR